MNDVPVLLTVAEAADLMRRHPQTVRALCRSGELAYQQNRRRGPVFIWESAVVEYLASQRVPASAGTR